MTDMLSWPAKKLCLVVAVVLACLVKCLLAERKIIFETYCISSETPKEITSDGDPSAGILFMQDKERTDLTYLPGLNCSVALSAAPGHQLLLAFSLISLRNSPLDSLTVIYNSSNYVSHTLSGQKTCVSENCSELLFESGKGYPNLTLNFVSANSAIPKNATGFIGTYTVFDYTDSQNECHGENQFVCNNKHCIWNGLVCDGHNNCGDRSDELGCKVSIKDTVWGIVVIAVGVVSLLVLVPMFCYFAAYGTRNKIMSLTMPVQPTPMYPTLNDGETRNLLTSSEIPPDSEGSIGDSDHPMNYGTDNRPSTSQTSKRFGSFFSEELSNEKFT